MMRSSVIYFILFFVYVIAQAFFKNLVLFNTAFCFVYVAFILLMPIETNNLVLMIAGFAIGFTIDIFYDSLGMHAFTMVLIAYIRNYWLGIITPQGGYDAGALPNVPAHGLQWFLVYTLPLVFVHHLILFLVEASGTLFWYSMIKTINSLLFTMTIIVLLQYLVPQRSRI
ncbi:rod shape-determining protein MreD [Cytophagales bacterium WSM2-2]|nr:rod shape-determining protein MreD [Cytophagales bacterium WSM2-2]